MAKMKTYDSFAAWRRDQPAKYRALVSKLRKIVAGAAPALVETSKWGNGVWAGDALPILFLHAAEDHLEFGFFAGAKLKDPKKLLRGKGKYVRHVRLKKAADIDEAALSALIRKAAKAPAYR